MTHILSRDYGISISSGRVYRLMRSMTLPKPSSVKPKRNPQKDSGECHNLLRRQFHPSAPNLVWVSDFTYLRVNRNRRTYHSVEELRLDIFDYIENLVDSKKRAPLESALLLFFRLFR